MDPKQLITKFLKQNRVLQLATSVNNQPWACNVHYIIDEGLNIIWISTPQRRHSIEIAENAKAAFVLKVHEDTAEEPYVIGLSGEGEAALIPENEIESIAKDYFAQTGKPQSLLKDILDGKNPHKFYKLRITSFVLFDTKNFPDDPRQEIVV